MSAAGSFSCLKIGQLLPGGGVAEFVTSFNSSM
jgi:hypothetical protein